MKYNKKKMIYSVTSSSSQHYCEREGNKIATGGIVGYIPFSKKAKGSKFKLEYDLSIYIPLLDFLLSTTLSKRMFIAIIRDVIDNYSIAESLRLNKDQIEFRIEFVMFNQTTLRTYFIYVPIQPYYADGSFKKLLSDVIKNSSFDSREDTSYVSEFIQLVNEGSAPSIYTLREYCNRNDITNQVSDKISVLRQEKMDPDQENYVVNEDINGNVTIFHGSTRQSSMLAYLTAKCMTPVVIDKLPFRIGKLVGENELRVENNLISRKHAIITCQEHIFYIEDLESTNGTFVNDNRIVPKKKHVLNDGDKIAFANQEFLFRIED